MKVQTNPFLLGNYAPIRSEDDFCLEVDGEFPKEMHGTFYRNGPNSQFDPRDDNYHVFAGDGMIHAFYVHDGKVSYKNRWVRTQKWTVENQAGKALFGTFGDPATTDPSVLDCDGGIANTNIIWHGNKLLALEEMHPPFAVEPGSLKALGYVPYAGKYKTFTAHPKIDATTGELIFFGYGVGDETFSKEVSYGVVDHNGNVTRLTSIEAPFASMMHDFFVTENYVMFPSLPLTFSLERAMSGKPALAWDPDMGSHVGVMRRDAGVESIRWFSTDPCYVFHAMNMWEQENKLYVDVMRYDSAPLFPNADGSPEDFSAATLNQWTLDLTGSTNDIKATQIDDSTGEFPRVDDRRAGLPYRHGYFAASTITGRDEELDSVAHLDFKSGKKLLYKFPAGDVVGEPVFVPRSATSQEGDGWLVAIVYRAQTNTSDFVAFEAGDISKGPIATAKLPRRIPFGFHGNWVPSAPSM